MSIAYLGTAIVLIATYFSLLWLYAVNIPIADDYDTVFAFYLNYDQIESSSQLAHLFFAQHNEHRLFFDRLVFFAERLIAGEADLRRLIVIGNLALVGIFFLFFRIYRNSEIFPLIILAAPLLLFNFMSFETMFWAMASLSNFYVVFFSLMSFVLLTEYKEHRYFLGALTVAALSLYTQANGLLALLIGMLWLGWKTYESPSVQNKIYSGLWLGVTLLVVVFYFSSYTKPPHHPSIIESIKDPTYTLEYFFAFLGSPLSYLGTRASIISGLFIFVLFLYLTYRQYFKKRPAVYGFILFLLGSAAMTALARSGFGIDQALSSRYTIISSCLWLVVLGGMLEVSELSRHWHKKLQIALVVLALSHAYMAYTVKFPIVKERRNNLIEGLSLFQQQQVASKLHHPGKAHAKNLLQRMQNKAYYNPPVDILKDARIGLDN